MLNKKKLLNRSVKNSDLRPLTDKERFELQALLLQMSKDIDEVCRKHNIKLFLVGGSLLGAVRHGGFIPWDDDIDFGMMREDYKKFINVFDKELGDSYYLRCPNSDYPNGNRFMQIFKKGTLLVSADEGTPLQPKCVLIDIFPYDYAPNNLIYRTIKGLYCNMLMIIAAAVTNWKYRNHHYEELMSSSFEGRIIINIEKLLGFIFSWRSPEKWFNYVDKAIQSKKTSDFVTSATGRKHYLGEIFPKDVFLPLTEIKFEGEMFYAPQKSVDYLIHNYGEEYLIIPPATQRESHFIKKLSLNNDNQ